MKKILFILSVVLTMSFAASAAPGDTTWVQANIARLSWNGNYDTIVSFPSSGVTYRKILMIFTLGKYMCPGYNPAYTGTGPGGTGWCADWDYTVQNFLMTPGGDSLELGRFITPYANSLTPRIPWAWTDKYVYDVTDYAPVLHGSALMRIAYSGYSGGFTGNIRFAFIEGTPDRNVFGVKRLWTGTYAYGDTSHSDSNNINVHFVPKPLVAPAGTVSADLKFTVTGHGEDGSGNCNEFCTHNYRVLVNGAITSNTAIWRDNCGSNELYPQSGTWLLTRANWCPGALVYSNIHLLPGIVGGSAYNLGIKFDTDYVSSGGAMYTTEGHVIYYGAMNKTLDASIETIISPTTDQNQYRENPRCEQPTIRVKNTGSTTLTSIDFAYGVKDSALSTYTWTGSLGALEETDVILPGVPQQMTLAGDTSTFQFVFNITAANGTPDDDSTNNTMSAPFKPAPFWNPIFRIILRTNNEALVSNPAICETSWQIMNMSNTVIYQRVNNALNTTYIDTISLGPGCFKFVVTDSGCDGLHWWVWDATPSAGVSAGYIYPQKLNGVYIQTAGNVIGGTYNNDFGCGFTQYFFTNWPAGIDELKEAVTSIQAYPDPANTTINIDLQGLTQVNGTVVVIDVMGRVVKEFSTTTAHNSINVSNLANGMYTVQYFDNTSIKAKLQTRFVVAK